MATLNSLKRALKRELQQASDVSQLPMSDEEYSAGFEILTSGAGWMNYEDFIIPQASCVLGRLLGSRDHVSILEIGPGPRSVLTYVPCHLRNKVTKYMAFEPNNPFATRLEESLGASSEKESTLPCLTSPPEICSRPFNVKDNKENFAGTSDSSGDDTEKFDIILFFHSMYGMKPKHKAIERAMELLSSSPTQPDDGGSSLFFHRNNTALHFGNLLCRETATFHRVVSMVNNDKDLDAFASFVTGVSMHSEVNAAANGIRAEWRKLCRGFGRREAIKPKLLLFSSPQLMMTFLCRSGSLPTLTDKVPVA
jgi:hypothetical protein